MDIIGATLAATTCYLLVRYLRKRKGYAKKHRSVAEREYFALSVAAPNPCFSFKGSSAEVVHEIEQIEESRGVFLAYALTRVAINEHGEYFWFYFRTDSPSQFKHLDQARAKLLLKHKFVAPS